MEDFVFKNATKIVFGRGAENAVGSHIRPYAKKVLFHYGGGSIKKNGVYDRVIKSLDEEGIESIELPGVQPNPRLNLVKEGIDICRREKISFILAVGGGSVIDSAKAIAAGVLYEGEVWDLFNGKETEDALPIGVILTIPAAGSESSNGSVITNEDGWYKRAAISECLRPQFAILNPEISYTLSGHQTMVGVADITAHLIERYFTNVSNVDLSDRLIEGSLKSVIHNSHILLEEPENYHARAEIMWAGTLAHNDLFSSGRIGDWASHQIEHELSALFDIPHGMGLSIIIPAWMTYVYKEGINKFVQFAYRVWDVETTLNFLERVAVEGIRRLKEYYRGLGLPVSLREVDFGEDRFEEMAEKCTEKGPVGNFKKLGKEDIIEIFRLAM